MSRRRCCCGGGNCIPYTDVVEFAVNPWCGVRVYVTDGVGTGWYTGIESCSSEPGWLGVWSVRLVNHMPMGMVGLGSIRYSDFVLDGGTYCLNATPTRGPNSLTVCVVGCDGEPINGALLRVSSVDPSGAFVMPPVPEDDDTPAETNEDGCLTFDVPPNLDGDAVISIYVVAPPEYQPTTIETTRNAISAQSGGFKVTPDVDPNYTCCDLVFRQGPINPGGTPTSPRGKTLFWITSGDPGEAYKTIEVGCEGYACGLSDTMAVAGGPPVVFTCPQPREGNWDWWTPPTLAPERVPILFRCWYADGDWHAQVKAKFTVARPADPFYGCDGDPSLNVTDFYGWWRKDASCDPDGDPMLSLPPDPELQYPYGTDPGDGGTWYDGSTRDVVITASSYVANVNNPVDVTFTFPSVTLAFHSGNVAVKLVDTISVWQPPPAP